MRLRVLDSGHGFGTKTLFALIRAASRQPVFDVIKLVKYRSDFYGAPMSAVTHEAMRGPSTWSVADRELMAAFVARINQCEFCTKTHAAVAQRAYGDGKKVSSLLSDVETATIEEPLRATLLMMGKLTLEHAVSADDMQAVLASGASRQQVEDALAVCFSFNVIGRLADAFGLLFRVLRRSRLARNTSLGMATAERAGCQPKWSFRAAAPVRPELNHYCVAFRKFLGTADYGNNGVSMRDRLW